MICGTTGRSCWCSSDISVDCTAANMPRSCVSATTRSRVWARTSSRSGRVTAATPRRSSARSRSRSSCSSTTMRPPREAASLRTLNWFQLLHPRTWKATRETSKRGHHVHKSGKRVKQIGATFVIGAGRSGSLRAPRCRQHGSRGDRRRPSVTSRRSGQPVEDELRVLDVERLDGREARRRSRSGASCRVG